MYAAYEGMKVIDQQGNHATVKCFDEGSVYLKFDGQDKIMEYSKAEFFEIFLRDSGTRTGRF